MEVKIGRGGRHGHGAKRTRVLILLLRIHASSFSMRMKFCRCGGRGGIRQIIFQAQDEKVARIQPQIRRLVALRIEVAIASRAIRLGRLMKREVNFQNPIPAAQIFGLGNAASRGGTGTSASGRILSPEHAMPWRKNDDRKSDQSPLFHVGACFQPACWRAFFSRDRVGRAASLGQINPS